MPEDKKPRKNKKNVQKKPRQKQGGENKKVPHPELNFAYENCSSNTQELKVGEKLPIDDSFTAKFIGLIESQQKLSLKNQQIMQEMYRILKKSIPEKYKTEISRMKRDKIRFALDMEEFWEELRLMHPEYDGMNIVFDARVGAFTLFKEEATPVNRFDSDLNSIIRFLGGESFTQGGESFTQGGE